MAARAVRHVLFLFFFTIKMAPTIYARRSDIEERHINEYIDGWRRAPLITRTLFLPSFFHFIDVQEMQSSPYQRRHCRRAGRLKSTGLLPYYKT